VAAPPGPSPGVAHGVIRPGETSGGESVECSSGPVARFFKFEERGTNIITESRAGLTTFMVMAYIIFLNGSIIAGRFISTRLPLRPEPAFAQAC